MAHEYYMLKFKKIDLCRKYGVSYPTVNKVLERARHGDFQPRKSVNQRYRSIEYGLRRLARVQARIEAKLKARARRYNKRYPGELFHFDTKCLPVLKHESRLYDKQYLFVAIDDYSRELYAGIYPDKSSDSSTAFLKAVIRECPYTIERILTDNGTEYKGWVKYHQFMQACFATGIRQIFTKPAHPQTNGKAERVIRTLMEQWYANEYFAGHRVRKRSLVRYVNYYNTVKPHKGIDNQTPLEKLCLYFYPEEHPELKEPVRLKLPRKYGLLPDMEPEVVLRLDASDA
jgi:transposase InsO family protein